MDHAVQDRQMRLYKNLLQSGQHVPGNSFSDKISHDQTCVHEEKSDVQLHNSGGTSCLSSTLRTRNRGYSSSSNAHTYVNVKLKHKKTVKSNRQQDTRIAFQKSEECLLKDFEGLKLSAESMDDFAEVIMLDFAGQYEFYATHQTFLNKHAVYLLVLDISKDLKGSLTSEDQDDALPNLAEIPLEDIGGEVIVVNVLSILKTNQKIILSKHLSC